MPAQPLFDAAALPTWLGGTATPSMPLLTEPPAGAGNMAANALVDPSVLPQWMRDAPAPRPEPSGPPDSSTVSQWLASPVTDEPLPGFLDQIYADAEVPRLDHASPAAMGGEPMVDAGALPAWLRAPASPGVGLGMTRDMGGFAGGESVPLPPPVMPQAPGYGAPVMPVANEPAAAPLFSAKELVEPDALPAWAQAGPGQDAREQGHMPVAFEMDAAALPDAPPRWPDQEYDQAAQLPQGSEASQPGKAWPPRGDQPSIPVAELPPWLREGQSPAAAEAPQGFAGFEEFQGFDAGDMPIDAVDPEDQAPGVPLDAQDVQHYADRFGNERPGVAGRFGYEFDYGPAGTPSPEAVPTPVAPGKGAQDRKGGKRRGLFRRR